MKNIFLMIFVFVFFACEKTEENSFTRDGTYLLNSNMFIEQLKTMRLYERQSKLGVYHTFHRKNTIYIFKCDSCGVSFLRPRAKVDPERASNDYKHVCSFCDTKKFAQKVGVKMRKIYRMDASSTQRL